MTKKKDILETHPHLASFFVFLEHLNQESDRGCVLIVATMIDDILAKTLRAFLIKGKNSDKLIEGFNAPLGTFSARIASCSAMGLISHQELADIEIIRKIRNDFAHTVEITFVDQKIMDLCAQLHHSAKSYADVVMGTKGQFTSAATSIILNLTNRPHYVSEARLTTRSWAY